MELKRLWQIQRRLSNSVWITIQVEVMIYEAGVKLWRALDDIIKEYTVFFPYMQAEGYRKILSRRLTQFNKNIF